LNIELPVILVSGVDTLSGEYCVIAYPKRSATLRWISTAKAHKPQRYHCTIVLLST